MSYMDNTETIRAQIATDNDEIDTNCHGDDEENTRIQAYKKAFALFDKNEATTVSSFDIKEMLLSIDQNHTDEEVENIINAVLQTKTENGQIKFHEFVDILENEKATTNERVVREAFQVMDPEGNGYITLDDLKHVIENLGLDVTHEEMQYMADKADPKETGNIEYEGLIKQICGDNEILTKAYRKRVKLEEKTRRKAERAQFKASISNTCKDKDTGVPDMAKISSQFDQRQYDRYSRKITRIGLMEKRALRKVPLTRTRQAFLQKESRPDDPDNTNDTDTTEMPIGQHAYPPDTYTRTGSIMDQRLLDPSYYLKKTKEISKNNLMNLGNVHMITDEFEQEIKRLRQINVHSNKCTPRSTSVELRYPSTTSYTPLSFTEDSNTSISPAAMAYAQRAQTKMEQMNAKLYTSLWRTAFTNAIERLQVKAKEEMSLSTPDIEDDEAIHNPNINSSDRQNHRVSVISPFLDAPSKNTVQDSDSFRRFHLNGSFKQSRKIQAPLTQQEKYHRDFLQPNILPKIEPRPKQRDAISKTDLIRIINSLN